MTLAQLVILPGVLLAAFLAVLLVLALRLTRTQLRVLAARHASAAIGAERYRATRALAAKQGDVIAAVIAELGSRPATYETFPPDVREALYAAHEAAQRREIP